MPDFMATLFKKKVMHVLHEIVGASENFWQFVMSPSLCNLYYTIVTTNHALAIDLDAAPVTMICLVCYPCISAIPGVFYSRKQFVNSP